jgi:hypothetical protein
MEESLAAVASAGVTCPTWPAGSVGLDAVCTSVPADIPSQLEYSAGAGSSPAETGVEDSRPAKPDAGAACSVGREDTVGLESVWASVSADIPSRLEYWVSAG